MHLTLHRRVITKVALNINLTVSYLRNFVCIIKQILKIFTKSKQILDCSNRGHVGRIREIRNAYQGLAIKPKGKRSHGRLRPSPTLMLNVFLKLWGGRVWTRFIWLRLRVSGTCCEHDNKLSGSKKADRLLAFKAGIFSMELAI
jgi:hypothetical protein